MSATDDTVTPLSMKRVGRLPAPPPLPAAVRTGLVAAPRPEAAHSEPPVRPVVVPEPVGEIADAPGEGVGAGRSRDEARADLRKLRDQYADDSVRGVNLDVPASLWDTARRHADELGVPYRFIIIEALHRYLQQESIEIREGYAQRGRL